MKKLELTKRELLVEKLVDELTKIYVLAGPLPDIVGVKKPHDLKKYNDMLDLLASKIDYNKYMLDYIELTGIREDEFDEFFNDLVFYKIF